MRLHKQVGFKWLHSLIEAQVDQHCRGGSTHACSAVNVHLALFVKEFLQSVGGIVEFLGKICLVEVMNWEVDCFHIQSRVSFKHFGPVNASMLQIYFCLHIKYAGDARVG